MYITKANPAFSMSFTAFQEQQVPLRILLVEDEVIVALELQQQLENLGYSVIDTAHSGRSAIEKAQLHRPDLILMDVRLEDDITGIEAAEIIQSKFPTPVIFLTAYSDQKTLEAAKKTSPYGYLLKPLDSRILGTTIEIAINKFHLKERLQQSRDDLLYILNGLAIGTVMTDIEGRITFASQVACDLLHLNMSDLEGLRWQKALPFPQALIKQLLAMAQTPAYQRSRVPVRLEHGNGTTYWLEVDIRDDPQSPSRHLFVLYDVTEVQGLRQMLDEHAQFHDIVGKSEAMKHVFQQISQVARVDSTVLIHGATGTGKELVARAIHNASPRSNNPFIAVNCAALSDELAASQLFGHKRGSFTGAISDHKGFFEAAEGGTLFLDEIGDIPKDVQVNLLRVLEQRTVTRVGETQPRPVDVRILAATHRDLLNLVEEGSFRADLLYRIRIARVEIPALNERREDIPLLVRSFLQQCQATTGITISDVNHGVMRLLLEYPWPGNVRELRNAIEYAVIHARTSILHEEDLPPEIQHHSVHQLNLRVPIDTDDEKSLIMAALEKTGGNRKEAARVLGISRATFYRRLEEYDIK